MKKKLHVGSFSLEKCVSFKWIQQKKPENILWIQSENAFRSTDRSERKQTFLNFVEHLIYFSVCWGSFNFITIMDKIFINL